MKNIVICAAVIALLPNMANAGYCNTCAVQFKDGVTIDAATWTNTGKSSGSNYGNYYTTSARPPTASTSYTSVCETSCYGSTYSAVYTCSPGYRFTSTGATGYYGDAQKRTRVYTSSSGFVCPRCPHGSYSNLYGQTECTLCPGGYMTTGPGGRSCSSYPCSGFAYTETWKTPSWADSTQSSVSNLCVATKCKAGAYLNGTTCTACPAGTYNPNAGATSSNACVACPSVTGIYTDAARTTLAVPTSASGSTSNASCYLGPGTYYDASGTFTITSNCPY